MNTAVAKAEPGAQPVALIDMIARAASDPSVDIEKMERLMAMQERMVARQAETDFSASMSEAQGEMGPVSKDASNPQTRSRYASYDKLDAALRPIYVRHGFAISYDSEQSPLPEHIRVLAYVSHRAGHTKTFKVDIPTDGKGPKGNDVMTKTHATVAGMSYGKRTLLKAIFNVAEGEGDTDGNDPRAKPTPPPPAMTLEQFENWRADMVALADEGSARLQGGWERGGKELRKYVSNHFSSWWAELKVRAEKVGA